MHAKDGRQGRRLESIAHLAVEQFNDLLRSPGPAHDVHALKLGVEKHLVGGNWYLQPHSYIAAHGPEHCVPALGEQRARGRR